MKVETHYHLNLLVVDCRREVMRRVQRLNLHLHSEEATSRSTWKKKKKNHGYASGKTSLVCHCCRKKGHSTANCWYSKVCSFCGKKGHHVASCWEKQATCHKPDCFQRRNGKKTSPIQQQIQRHMGEKEHVKQVHTTMPRNFSTTAS
jgi:hypothetical protein